MKRLFLVWNLQMTECVGFESEEDAIYTSIGDRAAAEYAPAVPSLGCNFREMYAEGKHSSEYDYDSTYGEEAPEDLITLPMTDIEIED